MNILSIIAGIILGIVLLTISFLTGYNFWILLAISFPILFVVFLIIFLYKNTSPSVEFEEIPEEKYMDRINTLNRKASEIHPLGFRKIDHFFVKMNPEVLVYVLKNDEKNCFACLYSIYPIYTMDFIAIFKGDYAITTSTSLDAAKFPLGDRSMLQCFPKQNAHPLFDAHLKAIDFVTEKGLKIYDVPDNEFREKFRESLIKAREKLRSFRLWPLALIYRSFVNDSKSYTKSMEEQYKEGRYNFLDDIKNFNTEDAEDTED